MPVGILLRIAAGYAITGEPAQWEENVDRVTLAMTAMRECSNPQLTTYYIHTCRSVWENIFSKPLVLKYKNACSFYVYE